MFKMKTFNYRIVLKLHLLQQSKLSRMGVRYYHSDHLKVSRLYPGMGSIPQGAVSTQSSSQASGDGESVCVSQKLMQQLRLVHGAGPGSFYTLQLLTRSLEKLHRIIDQQMQNIGAQKITMPCLAQSSLWKSSNRWEIMGSELLKLQDRHGRDMCLAPTHEEAVTSLVASVTDPNISHTKLPIKLYQIGRKFRDEMRPKHGLLRGREFEMKDLYTFDATLDDARKTYEEVCDTYSTLFERLGLDALKVEADTGAMGGSMSHEYHIQSSIGEDVLLKCAQCGKCINQELRETLEESRHCPELNCPGTWNTIPGIEVAHAFVLGTQYSSKFKARYRDIANGYIPYEMGCFGIGVTRLLAAAVEVLSSEEGIVYPALLAPHQVCIISQQTGFFFEESLVMAKSLQEELLSKPNLHNEVILDDRFQMSIGKRIKSCVQNGLPHIVVLGKKVQSDIPVYEYHDCKNKEILYLTREEVIQQLSQIETIIV